MGKIDVMVDTALKIAKDDSHGYSQKRRWPSQGTDFDCSSLMYYCAHKAGYNVPLSGYTGTMLADFKKAGFTALKFTNVGLSGLKKGDILLNVEDHTEMCVQKGLFVGAHGSETGGIDGLPGDQTGNEISTCPAYVLSSGWDYVLRPPADGSGGSTIKKPTSPEYRVYANGKWQTWHKDSAAAGTAGTPIYDVDFRYLGPNGWYQLTIEGGTELARNTHNSTHKRKIIGITVYYDTPNPSTTGYYEAVYRVQTTKKKWLKWEHDDTDGGAGDDRNAVCRIQLKIAKCE